MWAALVTVGGAEAGSHEATIVLSLSVRVAEVFVVVRAQPSGTEILNPPFVRYGTNCVLSGMSPGGLLSVGTGDSTGIGEAVSDGLGPWVGGAVEVGADVLGALEVELDPFAHPARSSSPARA